MEEAASRQAAGKNGQEGVAPMACQPTNPRTDLLLVTHAAHRRVLPAVLPASDAVSSNLFGDVLGQLPGIGNDAVYSSPLK